jgi:hypothetical protein
MKNQGETSKNSYYLRFPTLVSLSGCSLKSASPSYSPFAQKAKVDNGGRGLRPGRRVFGPDARSVFLTVTG